MSSYQTGSVKLTVNSPTVIGYNTAFSTNVSAGDLFRVRESSQYAFYEIAAVTSATRISLTASFQDSSYAASTVLSGMPYQIVTDFTPHYSFPELGENDINFQNIYTRAMRQVDSELYAFEATAIEVALASVAELNCSTLTVNTLNASITTASIDTLNVKTLNASITNASITDLETNTFLTNNVSFRGGDPATNLVVRNGIKETAVAGTSLSFGDVCYYKSDKKYWKASANTETTSKGIIRMAIANINANASGLFIKEGTVRKDGWGFTAIGSPVFLATPVGELTQTPPSSTGEIVRSMGWAKTASTLEFQPSTIYLEME